MKKSSFALTGSTKFWLSTARAVTPPARPTEGVQLRKGRRAGMLCEGVPVRTTPAPQLARVWARVRSEWPFSNLKYQRPGWGSRLNMRRSHVEQTTKSISQRPANPYKILNPAKIIDPSFYPNFKSPEQSSILPLLKLQVVFKTKNKSK